MSYTVQNVIDNAAKAIGVLASGESLQTEEYADCLERLNTLLQSWDVERLNIFCIQQAQYTLVSGTNNYTIGPSGATFTAPRPVSIRSASITDASGIFTFQLKIVSSDVWDGIREKAAAQRTPEILYWDGQYPSAGMYFWPTPNQNCQLNLFTWEAFSQFTLISQTFDMPPAYQRAVEFVLALDIAPMFGRTVDQNLANIAAQSKQALQMLNLPPANGMAEDGEANAQFLQNVPPAALPASLRPKS